jgi:hypothetical protein
MRWESGNRSVAQLDIRDALTKNTVWFVAVTARRRGGAEASGCIKHWSANMGIFSSLGWFGWIVFGGIALLVVNALSGTKTTG